jgi:hypothetical protein
MASRQLATQTSARRSAGCHDAAADSTLTYQPTAIAMAMTGIFDSRGESG